MFCAKNTLNTYDSDIICFDLSLRGWFLKKSKTTNVFPTRYMYNFFFSTINIRLYSHTQHIVLDLGQR